MSLVLSSTSNSRAGTMNTYRKFLISAAMCVSGITAAYYAAFMYQLDAPIQAAYGVPDWATYKEQLSSDTEGKRILLFGDSSSLLGMNTPLLAEKTGMKVVNMALHGGLPLDWMTKYALDNSRKGDTVILSLAWTYYYRDYKNPEKWMLEQIVAWDRKYFENLDPLTKARFISGVDLKSLYNNIDIKSRKEEILKDYPLRKALTKEEVRSQYAEASKKGNQPFSYSFLNMNAYGDLQGACGNAIGPLYSYSISLRDKTTDIAFSKLQETAELMRQKGVKFYMAPSISLEDEMSKTDEYRANLRKILSELSRHGIAVIGNPNDFYFPASNFYDTNFHLNCETATARTLKLYDAIKPII